MLVRPKMNKVELEGDNEIVLVLTRKNKGIYYDISNESNVAVCISHFSFYGLTKKTRLGRFFEAMKIVCKFCK